MTRSYRPRLESLETRNCPSCDWLLIGTTLFVTGDAGDNVITITDNGPGDLHLECDGTPSDFSQTIKQIVLRTGQGGDTVEYQVTDPNWGRQRLAIDLGMGDDFLTLDAGSGLTTPAGQARPEIAILAGDGHDEASVRIGALAGGLRFSADFGAGHDLFDIGLAGSRPTSSEASRTTSRFDPRPTVGTAGFNGGAYAPRARQGNVEAVEWADGQDRRFKTTGVKHD